MAGDVLLRLFVPGRARTKGHMTPGHIRGQGGRPCKVWLKDRDDTKAWMKTLIIAVGNARVGKIELAEPYVGPVELHTFFRFERTPSVAKDAKTGQVWFSHEGDWPTADDIGDWDTLVRAVGDALTQARVIEDDDLVIGGMNYKRWCLPGEKPGVVVVVKVAQHVSEIQYLESMAWAGIERE